MKVPPALNSVGPRSANVVVLGRFPPPVDGQSLATARLATLLEDDVSLVRIDTEWADDVRSNARLPALHRAAHFLRLRSRLRTQLSDMQEATVLWPAVSPDVNGHIRDLTITLPAIRKFDSVFPIVHRGNFDRLFASRLTASTSRRMVRRMSGFIFLTQQLSEKCSGWIPEQKRIVIPNTIDDELIFSDDEIELKRLNRRERSELTVLFVGHMLPSKGYLDVVDAAQRAHSRTGNIKAYFVGGWQKEADRGDFAKRVERLGLETVVTHHGPLSDRAAMKSIYDKADVLVLPSYYRNEAQPLVILEALNAGVPVISTSHAGIPELITHEREGLLVPERDPGSLECAIYQLQDPATWMRMSKAARKKFLENYAPDVVRQNWLALLEHLPG